MVTAQLKELTNTLLLQEIDDEPFIQQGYYFISDGEYFTGTEGLVIINISDLMNCRDLPDRGRLSGCCGMDGTNGPNKVCINGHEIGTEKSDCWMANAFIFKKDAVNTMPKKYV
jgi:hypothetical protein